MKRIKLIALALVSLALSSVVKADSNRLLPDRIDGDGFEIPVFIIPAAGQVVSSVQPGDTTGVNMSATLGEPVAGAMTDASCSGSGEPCRLESGYGVFEFYSDRIPIYNFSILVNGGSPVTNTRDVHMSINFSDDLSGVSQSSFTDQTTGQTVLLNVNADNSFDWKLGGTAPDVRDGDFSFFFYFQDRAGNVTVNPATAAIRLDRVPPSQGTVVINKGNLFTSSQTVSVDVTSTDNNSPAPTGVSFVRLSNSANDDGVVYPFIEPKMGLQWTLDSSTGMKTVYAYFRDGAGNWTTQAATSSIIWGSFAPGGALSFKDNGKDLILNPEGYETTLGNVPLLIGWNPAFAGNLKQIKISGGVQPLTIDVPNGTLPPLTPSYSIAVDTAPDGEITVGAVFIDSDNNPSAPVYASINLNRTPPPDPSVVMDVQTTSITFRAEVPTLTHDVKRLTFEPDPGLYSLGASSASVPVHYSTEPVTLTDDGLIPNTAYSYRIRAWDDFSGSIPGFSTGPVFTRAETPTVTSPPYGLQVSVIRSTWGTGKNPVDTDYLLEWTKDSTFQSGLMDNGWSHVVPYDATGLSVGTTYYFRVRARNKQTPVDVETGLLNLGPAVTLNYLQPQPPERFFPVQIASTSILWQWVRNVSTEEGFIIRNATGGAVGQIPLVASTDTYTFLETGLIPNTPYSRTILSYNHLNSTQTLSSPSDTVNVLTRPAPPVTSSLTVVGSEITAGWDVNGNPDGTEYQVEIAMNLDFSNYLETSSWITTNDYTFRGLKPQTTYYVRVESRGQSGDESGWVNLGTAFTQSFGHDQELDLTDASANWKLQLSSNSLDQDFVVLMEADPARFTTTNSAVVDRATQKAMAETNGYRFPIPGGLIELSFTNADKSPLNVSFRKPGVLTNLFQNQLLQNQASHAASAGSGQPVGFMNSLNDRLVRLQTLRLWMLDTATESWVRLPSNDLDLYLNQVHGNLRTSGIFSVMGAPSEEVNDVIVYPVPWRPNGPNAGDGPGQTGTDTDSTGIWFADLPQDGTIRIFDLQGTKVKEINLTGQEKEHWNARNGAGEKVASGTYFWIALSGANKKSGKLVIIR